MTELGFHVSCHELVTSLDGCQANHLETENGAPMQAIVAVATTNSGVDRIQKQGDQKN